MSESYHWTCPYCNHDATLRSHDFVGGSSNFTIQNPVEGHKQLRWLYIVCPNAKCKKYTLTVYIQPIKQTTSFEWGLIGEIEKLWELIPPSKARCFPSSIPTPILDDYNEACLIVKQSPKASATLSRRCLQGIIRDFWGVKTGTLCQEIERIKDKIDPLTWDAIEAVRKVGNIGAHMEKDINIIIDVDPKEAELLIELIEILLKEWYLAREEKSKKLNGIKAMAAKKEEEKKELNKKN